MDQVISFDKSLQTRLQEYNEVFSGQQTLPFSKIQSEWTYYLELTLDPNGWQAVWKIPRVKCEHLKIPFPTVVLVYVINVSYEDLTGLVRILAVQDDINLPEKHYVSLTQLWPTKEQDKSIALNLNSTANALDMLRFFYIHLVMPWDEDDDLTNWKEAHLVSRLRLFYDLKNGKIPKAMSEHIHSLLNEARRLNCKRQMLASIFEGCDSDAETENEKNMEELIEINVRLIEIQNEVHMMENEMFRKVLLKRQDSQLYLKKTDKKRVRTWAIFNKGRPSDYIRFLKSIEEIYPDENLTFASDLMSKLETANSDDIILLNSVEHITKNEGILMDNFIIRGIGENNSAEIISLCENVMFDCIGNSSSFENLSIDARKSQCAILVRNGNVTLKKCNIIGDLTSTTHQGILVLNGAKLTLTNCEISGFAMAIVGNTGSTIDIKNSTIKEAYFGFKIFEGCDLGISSCIIKNCKEYGIVFETEKQLENERMIGDFDVLQCYIKVDSIQGIENKKADVLLKATKLKPLENLFENPELDPTVLVDSDEEMEGLDDTVLEVKKLDADKDVAH